jgi:hypothetical protein
MDRADCHAGAAQCTATVHLWWHTGLLLTTRSCCSTALTHFAEACVHVSVRMPVDRH